MVFAAILITVLLSAEQTEQETVTRLRDLHPENFTIDTHEDWKYYGFSRDLNPIVFHISSTAGTDTLALLIDSTLMPGIEDAVNDYIAMIEGEGICVNAFSVNPDAEAEDTRTFLDSLYKAAHIEGAVLIGFISPAWVQVEDDYNDYGYAEWPCDYYFMDLNGTWEDNYMFDGHAFVDGSDGVFDEFYGSVEPEIYIARILPPGKDDDTTAINDYFHTNEQYRFFKTGIREKALLFVDDDWAGSTSYWASCLSPLYDSMDIVSDPETTKALIYTEYMDSVYEWVGLYAHSWPTGHGFYFNSKASVDYYYASSYNYQNPRAHFFNFFCCSFARYTSSGYGAGMAVFNDWGLAAIGSAKTGSMLNFNRFYQPLADGKNLGQAFFDWFSYISNGGFSEDEVYWHMGMTLIGDPTLKASRGGPLMISEEITPTGEGIEQPGNIYRTVFYSVEDASDYIRLKNIRVFDKTGRQIESPPSSGVYFFNRTKIIIF